MNGVSVLNAEVAHTMFEGRSVEGITERWSEWGPELRSRATVRRAHWGPNAGLIGAAIAAHQAFS